MAAELLVIPPCSMKNENICFSFTLCEAYILPLWLGLLLAFQFPPKIQRQVDKMKGDYGTHCCECQSICVFMSWFWWVTSPVVTLIRNMSIWEMKEKIAVDIFFLA